MKPAIAIVAALLLGLGQFGCATLKDAQSARGTGTAKVYDKPYEVVWDAVLASVKATGLDLVANDKEKGTILGQGPVGPFTWGENVAIFVDDLGGRTRTRVEVVNKRAIATNVTARDWESRIFQDLDKRF